MATLLFDKSKLSQDQEDLLVLLANANPEINIRDLIEVETVNGVLANAIQVIVMGLEVTDTKPVEITGSATYTIPDEVETPKVEMRGKVHTPTGKCAKCFKEAVLVKATGLCKPCAMMAARERKALQKESTLPMYVGQQKVDRQIAARNARELAAVERVVAKAQNIGAVTVPLDQKGGLILSGTKVG